MSQHSFPRYLPKRNETCIYPEICTWMFIAALFFFKGSLVSTFKSIIKDFIYLLLERREGREKESGRNINVWLPFSHPLLGTWPAIQACALTGNQTGNLLACRPALNLLSHISQGAALFLISNNWIQPKWPSTDEWINKPQFCHLMEYVSAIKMNKNTCYNMGGSLNNYTEQKKPEYVLSYSIYIKF